MGSRVSAPAPGPSRNGAAGELQRGPAVRPESARRVTRRARQETVSVTVARGGRPTRESLLGELGEDVGRGGGEGAVDAGTGQADPGAHRRRGSALHPCPDRISRAARVGRRAGWPRWSRRSRRAILGIYTSRGALQFRVGDVCPIPARSGAPGGIGREGKQEREAESSSRSSPVTVSHPAGHLAALVAAAAWMAGSSSWTACSPALRTAFATLARNCSGRPPRSSTQEPSPATITAEDGDSQGRAELGGSRSESGCWSGPPAGACRPWQRGEPAAAKPWSTP